MTGPAWTRVALPALALALALVASTHAAFAGPVATGALDPSHAQSDVDAAMRELSFCRDPRLPLSSEARSLCPHAAVTPDCAGFAAACAATEASEDRPSPFLEKLLHALGSLGKYVPGFIKTLVGALARLPAVIFLLLVAAVLVAALFPVVRSLGRMKRDAALRERRQPPEKPGAEPSHVVETTGEEALLALADNHARKGQNDLALQLYLSASLRALDRLGAVRWARDRTNGEYVRSCTVEPLRVPLREIVREVDRVQFGHTPATTEVVSRAAQLAAGIVRWLPVVALVLGLPAMAGCGAWKTPRPGDDPAGNELLGELLKRQGVRVDALDGPLGSLPPPDGASDAVVVDPETTPLDDDTRSHLVDWARAGGVLVLVGAPEAWPDAYGVKMKVPSMTPSMTSPAQTLSASGRSDGTQTPVPYRGKVTEPAAFEPGVPSEPDTDSDGAEDDDARPEGVERIAWLDDGSTYAAVWPSGSGVVLGIASDELTTNAGLARPGNAAVLVAILSHTNRSALAIAQPEDGAAAPSSPLASLLHAGLGLALGHALAATLILFIAVGVRLAAPTPSEPPRRRAFVEHVEAVGALYARTGAARHALASYGRFVEQRLRDRMPRGASDLAAFLASRSHVPLETCQVLLARATAAATPEAENKSVADDLMVLKELSATYAAATSQDD